MTWQDVLVCAVIISLLITSVAFLGFLVWFFVQSCKVFNESATVTKTSTKPLTKEEKKALLWVLVLGILGTLAYVYWDEVLEGLKIVGTIVGFAAVLWGMGHSEDDDKCPLKQKKRLIYPGGFYIPPPPPSGS